MAVLSIDGVSVGFGGPPLLDRADFQIDRGERVCLVGRNGVGKSTLMKLINDEIRPDSGEIRRGRHVRVARLPQEIPQGLGDTVFQVVATGLAAGTGGPDDEGKGDGHQVESAISRLKLETAADFGHLSGGLQRRVLLARALVSDPDVLLLDEPTNHLDIAAIAWLEEFLLSRFEGSLLFVTHDRALVQRLATRIVELDRGRLKSWACDYATYQERSRVELEAEVAQAERFDRRLGREEAFIRQGIKARRTRNEGRVRAVFQMREEQRARRRNTGAVRLQAQEAERSGRLVIEAKGISFAYDGDPIVRDFSALISRGDKIGLIGPNGSGKTTLLRLLLGELMPQQGNVRHGVRLQIAYFDQLRTQLDEERSVWENVSGDSDMLTINGKRRHIFSYLQDFLFTSDRARSPVSVLSGGERNRLLLARLFTRPSNILVLDEPTNDLDTETLELLEEHLLGYPGTLLLVSHDRALLDNVVTSTLAFEGDGGFKEYIGGYADWQRQHRPSQSEAAPTKARPDAGARARPKRSPKLSYRQKQELEALPERIEALESEQERLHQQLADPAFYQTDGDRVAQVGTRLKELEGELAAAYQSWEALEELAVSPK